MNYSENLNIFSLMLICFTLLHIPIIAKTHVFANSSLSPIEKIDSLSLFAAQQLSIRQYDQSLVYLQQALDLSSSTADKYRYLELLVGFGRAYHSTNNYSLSQQYLFKFLEENDDTSNHALRSDAFGLISNNYNNLGDINAAYEYRLKSIEIDEILGDTQSIASSYYNLGSLFFYQDVFEKALEYYKKSNKLGHQIKNSKIIYNSTAAIGSVYGKLGKTELALEFNLHSLHIADSLEYNTGQAYSLGNIGSNYLASGEYVKAKNYIERSLSIKKDLGDKWGQIGSLLALSQLHNKTNNFKLAEKNIFTALRIAQDINARKRVADLYKDISILYSSIRENDLAIEYMNKYVSVKDSIMNENILREMSDRKSEFALQKKEYEIDLLKKDTEILKANEVTQRLKLISFGLLAVFFLIVSIVFISLLSKQKKLTQLLKKKKTEIETQKNKIQIQNKKLEHSNEDLQQFAYVASHDLREPLRMITSYGKILTRRYKEALDESGQEFLYFMTDAASRMDSLLLDLLDYAKTSSNTQPFEDVSTKELMETVQRLTERSFLEKNAELEINMTNFPVIKGRKSQLYQVFQNFITNGLKYNTQDNPKIKIDCTENSDEYVFTFTDNGIGIPKEHQAKIFEMFQRLHPKGEFEGTGIGLATCKKIADIHNGHITVRSQEGLGSTFSFHIPK